MTNITEHDLTAEEWREYEWDGSTYRIDSPTALYLKDGGTTHRVRDEAGIVHLVPAPGERGCALRWKPRNASEPVQF